MLLTFLVYQIYREMREATRDRDADTFYFYIGLKALATILLWPFIVIPLGAHLSSQRAKVIWFSSFSLLTLLSLITNLYLIVGILLASARIAVYVYGASIEMKDRENESNEQVIL